MGKIIAVCGSPCSGKTTFGLKLAQEIYFMNNNIKTVFLSPSLTVPSLGFIFPNGKNVEMHSVGTALDKTDIYKEDVMRQFVNVKSMRNFAFLGFKPGENRYSYPQLTEDKICGLFDALKYIADITVIDCTCDGDDAVSRFAKRDCDIALQLFNPDIRSMIYYLSCVNEFLSVEDKKIKVLNITDGDIYLPIEEIKACNGKIEYTVPYSRALKQQMITGTLSERLRDPNYIGVVSKIAKRVM